MARNVDWNAVRRRRKAREKAIIERTRKEIMKTPKYTGIPRGASKIEVYGNMVTKLTAIYTKSGERIPLPNKAARFIVWRDQLQEEMNEKIRAGNKPHVRTNVGRKPSRAITPFNQETIYPTDYTNIEKYDKSVIHTEVEEEDEDET